MVDDGFVENSLFGLLLIVPDASELYCYSMLVSGLLQWSVEAECEEYCCLRLTYTPFVVRHYFDTAAGSLGLGFT
jgi:hypothetical protein